MSAAPNGEEGFVDVVVAVEAAVGVQPGDRVTSAP
jgi:hypothetical protein